ncbi:MAG TPA: putative DNA-binding domain-containing protein [Holophagaceae bacterium]|nr:putative DNA-binding domain-containing protein [Holophagaceae bacterium]
MSERLERLQATMLDLLLDREGDAAFRGDPRAFGAARGLEEKDQDALARFERPLLTYRALARFALTDPLPDCFPITKALLKREGAWRDCVDAYLDSRSIRSPYYRHILPAFVGWLAESGWGADRWPFILQLAHYEYLELDVLRHPDEAAPSGLLPEPGPGRHAVLDGSTRNMAYQWQVQDATEEAPEPAEGPAFLFCHRDPEGSFQVREVDAPASAFLTRCLQGEALGAAAQAVGMAWDDASALLRELQAESAVLGYR